MCNGHFLNYKSIRNEEDGKERWTEKKMNGRIEKEKGE
jgi:hypothetical protein